MIPFSKGNLGLAAANRSLGGLVIGNIIFFIAACFGSLLTFASIDTVGRKRLQITAFFLLMVIFGICGLTIFTISSKYLFALFCLLFFFAALGPKITTFIVAGDSFCPRYQSISYLICAASGTVGKAISQGMFEICGPNASLNHLLQACAILMHLSLCMMLITGSVALVYLYILQKQMKNIPKN